MNKVKISQNFYPAGSTESTVEYTYLEATGTVKETQTLNSGWTFTSYAGTSNSNLTDYVILDFPENSIEETNYDSWIINQSTSGSANLRFMIGWSLSSIKYRYGLKWTGHAESIVASYNKTPQQPNPGASVTARIDYYDALSKRIINVALSSNDLYETTSLSQLEFNNLIFLPIFVICTTTVTENSNGTITTSGESINYYTWNDIKPEDKTPAGQYYETYKNLFTNRYEIISSSENTKTYRYCKCVLIKPYYGKSSRTYDKSTDTYIDPLVSENRYGYRQIFGTTYPNIGEYPSTGRAPTLMVLGEQNIPELGGIVYTQPAGVGFVSSTNNYSFSFAIEGNLELNKTTAASSDYNIFGKSGQYGGIIYGTTPEELPRIVFPSIVASTQNGKISEDWNGFSGNLSYYKGSDLHYQMYRPNFHQFSPFYYYSSFPISYLWKTIMSFGCYIASREIDAQVAPLGALLNGNPHIYCGNMNGDFITDGEAKQGDDISDLPQTKIGDIIQNTPYVPFDPSGGGSSDPGSDTDVAPGKTEGVDMLPQSSRTLGTGLGFITMYNITSDQLQTLGSILWRDIADYSYGHLDPETNTIVYNFLVQLSQDVTGTFDTSAILNYFVSLRQYPFSVGTLPISSNFGTSVYIGNGKVGIPISTGVRVLTSSIGTLSAGTCLVKPVTPYNDFRDYYNTTVTVFLPYCGSVELNPTEVINQKLSCMYAIDFYTGECTAYLTLMSNPSYIVGVANGLIGVDIPLTASAEAQIQARHIMDSAASTKMFTTAVTAAAGAVQGDMMSLVRGASDLSMQQAELNATQRSRSGVAAPYISGGSGGAAFFAPDSAFVIIRRGTYKRPDNYGSTVAYPSTHSARLNTFSGFTVCQNVEMTGVTATAVEKAQIQDLLQSGVYI